MKSEGNSGESNNECEQRSPYDRAVMHTMPPMNHDGSINWMQLKCAREPVPKSAHYLKSIGLRLAKVLIELVNS